MHYKYYYYSREQLLDKEKKCDSAPLGDDCMRSVTDCNDFCPMQTHTRTQKNTGMFAGSYEIKQEIFQCLI